MDVAKTHDCVTATSPIVLAPQTKNVPANTQNSFRPAAKRSVAIGCIATSRRASAFHPYARDPIDSGASRITTQIATTNAANPPIHSVAARQPLSVTIPRRSSNHRLATTAASTIDIPPVPTLTTTPHTKIIWFGSATCDEANTPTANSSPQTVRHGRRNHGPGRAPRR